MTTPVVLSQAPVELEQLEERLVEHFAAAQEAIAEGRPVVVEVSGADLLGQGAVADAAMAAALVGLARALAIEGVRPGWSVNVVTRGDGVPDPEAVAAIGMNGQMLFGDAGHLGRVRS